MRTPLLLALLAALHAVQGSAETFDEAWDAFEAETSLFAERPARQLQARLEDIKQRHVDVVSALDSGLVPAEMITEGLMNDPALEAMDETPESLHGMDVVTPGEPNDRLETVADGDGAPTIWIVGRNGLILRSDDEGANFARQDSGTSAALMTVDFLDSATGIAAGEGDTVLRTGDGGGSWTTAGQASGDHLSVDCTAEGMCLLGGAYPFVYRSANAGHDWERSPRLGPDSTTGGLAWLAPGTALLAGHDGIWRTTDGGATWTHVFDLAAGGRLAREDRLSAIDSPDGQSVWAVGNAAGYAVILRSRDAGLTWEGEWRGFSPPGLPAEAAKAAISLKATAVSAPDPAHVVVAGLDGHMLVSADGGDHWWMVVFGAGPEESLYALEMRDRRVGWAAGNHGEVRGTNAGWREWGLLRGLMFEMIMVASDILYEWEAR